MFRISGGKVPSKTELDTARADFSRAQANVAVAKASVASAVAQLNSAKTDMSKSTIRSPVTGVILSRQVDVGQTVAASFNTPTLFLIAKDLSSMELEVKVDEADVGQVKEGQTASFTVDAWPGKTFPATIKRVNVGSNSSTAATGSTAASGVISYNTLLTVANPDLTLRPGMTATATIIHVAGKECDDGAQCGAALRAQEGGGRRAATETFRCCLSAGRAGLPAAVAPSNREVEFGRGSRRTV